VFTSHGHRGRIRPAGAAAAVSVLRGVLLAGPAEAARHRDRTPQQVARPRPRSGPARRPSPNTSMAVKPIRQRDRPTGATRTPCRQHFAQGPTSRAHRRVRRTPHTRTTLDRWTFRRPTPHLARHCMGHCVGHCVGARARARAGVGAGEERAGRGGCSRSHEAVERRRGPRRTAPGRSARWRRLGTPRAPRCCCRAYPAGAHPGSSRFASRPLWR